MLHHSLRLLGCASHFTARTLNGTTRDVHLYCVFFGNGPALKRPLTCTGKQAPSGGGCFIWTEVIRWPCVICTINTIQNMPGRTVERIGKAVTRKVTCTLSEGGKTDWKEQQTLPHKIVTQRRKVNGHVVFLMSPLRKMLAEWLDYTDAVRTAYSVAPETRIKSQ